MTRPASTWGGNGIWTRTPLTSSSELSCASSDERGSGRRHQLDVGADRFIDGPGASQHLERGRRWEGTGACQAWSLSREWRAVNAADAELIEQPEGADHVDQRVGAAQFVEVELFDRHSVQLRLGARKAHQSVLGERA